MLRLSCSLAGLEGLQEPTVLPASPSTFSDTCGLTYDRVLWKDVEGSIEVTSFDYAMQMFTLIVMWYNMVEVG